eukprot:COSAG04_NODE_2519_length_3980_cov_3.188354_1_plen_107_part_10
MQPMDPASLLAVSASWAPVGLLYLPAVAGWRLSTSEVRLPAHLGCDWVLAAALAATPNPTGALGNGLGRDRPALGWSSWDPFSCGIHDTLFRQTADALVASGLRDAG